MLKGKRDMIKRGGSGRYSDVRKKKTKAVQRKDSGERAERDHSAVR